MLSNSSTEWPIFLRILKQHFHWQTLAALSLEDKQKHHWPELEGEPVGDERRTKRDQTLVSCPTDDCRLTVNWLQSEHIVIVCMWLQKALSPPFVQSLSSGITYRCNNNLILIRLFASSVFLHPSILTVMSLTSLRGTETDSPSRNSPSCYEKREKRGGKKREANLSGPHVFRLSSISHHLVPEQKDREKGKKGRREEEEMQGKEDEVTDRVAKTGERKNLYRFVLSHFVFMCHNVF